MPYDLPGGKTVRHKDTLEKESDLPVHIMRACLVKKELEEFKRLSAEALAREQVYYFAKFVNASSAGQGGRGHLLTINKLEKDLAAANERINKLKQVGGEFKKLADSRKGELEKLGKALEQAQFDKATAESNASQAASDLERSQENCDALQKALSAEEEVKANLEREKAELAERVATLTAQMEEAGDAAVEEFLNGERYQNADADNKYSFLRAFMKRLSEKFPAPIAAKMVEGTDVFKDQYFASFFTDKRTKEVSFPLEAEDPVLDEDCDKFDAWESGL